MIDAGKLGLLVHGEWHGELIHATNAINSDRPHKCTKGYHKTTDQREIDICLNCKRKRCTGGEKCFAKLREAKKEL
jgi:hypothetical protein